MKRLDQGHLHPLNRAPGQGLNTRPPAPLAKSYCNNLCYCNILCSTVPALYRSYCIYFLELLRVFKRAFSRPSLRSFPFIEEIEFLDGFETAFKFEQQITSCDVFKYESPSMENTVLTGKIFFGFLKVLFRILLYLPPLIFRCVEGFWD
jgi:hypothetical protein